MVDKFRLICEFMFSFFDLKKTKPNKKEKKQVFLAVVSI